MRTLFLLLFSFTLFVPTHAQYVVLNINEQVYADDKLLNKKDKISSDAKLRFSSANAFAYVLSPGKGYFILGIKDGKKETAEFTRALKDALLPPNEYHAAATRANDLYPAMNFEDQYDLKAFFRERLFFVNPATFEVSAQHFPLDSSHFFVIRHEFSDGWISKKLPHQEQTFEISPQVLQLQGTLFKENTIQRSQLFYINQETGEEQLLSSFNLQFRKQEAIREELSSLHKALGKMEREPFLRDHALPYLYLMYGKTQPQAIMEIIERL